MKAADKWNLHHSEIVTVEMNVTIRWVFLVHTDHTIKANKPEFVVKDKHN